MLYIAPRYHYSEKKKTTGKWRMVYKNLYISPYFGVICKRVLKVDVIKNLEIDLKIS